MTNDRPNNDIPGNDGPESGGSTFRADNDRHDLRPALDVAGERRTPIASVELREEVLDVQKVRERIGSVEVRRERRTRQETVQVELVTEVITITTRPGGPSVTVDGAVLAPGEVREVVVYDERAQLGKEVVVSQVADIYKDVQVDRHSESIELAYEELVVDRSGISGLKEGNT